MKLMIAVLVVFSSVVHCANGQTSKPQVWTVKYLQSFKDAGEPGLGISGTRMKQIEPWPAIGWPISATQPVTQCISCPGYFIYHGIKDATDSAAAALQGIELAFKILAGGTIGNVAAALECQKTIDNAVDIAFYSDTATVQKRTELVEAVSRLITAELKIISQYFLSGNRITADVAGDINMATSVLSWSRLSEAVYATIPQREKARRQLETLSEASSPFYAKDIEFLICTIEQHEINNEVRECMLRVNAPVPKAAFKGTNELMSLIEKSGMKPEDAPLCSSTYKGEFVRFLSNRIEEGPPDAVRLREADRY